MITGAHNYTLIDTRIYGIDYECNTGMKGQYTLPLQPAQTSVYSDLHAHGRKHMPTHILSLHWRIFLSGYKVNVKCMVGNDDVKV